MKISRKSSSFAAVVLLAGLSLSACGDKDDSPAADKPGASSTTKASGEALTDASVIPAVTAAATKASTSHVSMTIGVGGQSIKAEGDVEVGAAASDTSMALTMDLGMAGAGKLDMRLVDQVFYLNFGSMTQNKFARIDLTDESNPLGKQYGQLIDQVDPSKQLKQFAKALKSFDKKGGAEQIDGVDAQPYEIVVDTAKIAGLLDLPNGASSSIPETMTYTMFIGPDNLPRRIATDVAGAKMTVDYSKWGESVDIKAPAAGDISDQDLSKLMGSATAS